MRVPVVCAVSGGVDSAVSLLKLLRSPNHHVTTALFMRNWDTREELSANDRCSVSIHVHSWRGPVAFLRGFSAYFFQKFRRFRQPSSEKF